MSNTPTTATGTSAGNNARASNATADLKFEHLKIPEFFGESQKDPITTMVFIKRVDECVGAKNWTGQVASHHLSLALKSSAEKWLNSKLSMHPYTAAEKTWTSFKPLFKREFATQTDDKFIINGLMNINMKPRKIVGTPS
jgi:hypothetical protein